MSKKKRSKVIHVDRLVVHAKEVEVIQEKGEREEETNIQERPRRDPWEFFWGRPRPQQESDTESDKK